MINAENISFRYDKKKPWIIEKASIQIHPGEIVGLMGPSGQGKTTFGKILAGYLPLNQGRVRVNKRPLPTRGYCPVQMIFQHPELAINPRRRIGAALTEGHTPSKQILESLSIDAGWLDRWPHELSGGELQRIAVARVLGPKTHYLIADETTAMLDAITQAQIWHVILHHARDHRMGVLAISHQQALLERVSDRIEDFPQINRFSGDASPGDLQAT